MSFTDLIAKLDAASEGSRDLDARIDAAIHGRIIEKIEGAFDLGNWHTPGRYWYDRVQIADSPPYTESIDIALTLVPDDWATEMRSRGGKTRFIAEIAREDSAGGEDYQVGRATTPALAICIAALKARAAQDARP